MTTEDRPELTSSSAAAFLGYLVQKLGAREYPPGDPRPGASVMAPDTQYRQGWHNGWQVWMSELYAAVSTWEHRRRLAEGEAVRAIRRIAYSDVIDIDAWEREEADDASA